MPKVPNSLVSLLPLLFLFCPVSSRAHSDEQMLVKQCTAAETAQECQQAIPACEKLEAVKLNLPSSRSRDLALAKIRNELLECEEEIGQYAAAERHGRWVLSTRLKRLGPEHPEIAESLNNLALVVEHQAKYGEAELLQRTALKMRQKLLGFWHPDVAESISNLAIILEAQGKYREAEALYRQALTIKQRLLGADGPETARSLSNLAQVLQRQGKYDEMEAIHRQVLKTRQQYLGIQHPQVAESLSNLAGALLLQGKYAEAETLNRQALAMSQKLLGSEHPQVATSLTNLSAVLFKLDKYDEAEVLNRQALAMRRKLLGTNHPVTADSLGNLAAVLQRLGKYDEAEMLFQQGLSINQRQLGSEHPSVALGLGNLGRFYLASGRSNAALAPLLQAVNIRESQLRATVSEPRMRALLLSLRGLQDTVYTLLYSDSLPDGPKLALTQALLWKGRATEAGMQANQLLHQYLNRSTIHEQFERWQATRQQREVLLYGGPGQLPPVEFEAKLKDLQLQVESLEAQLAQALPKFQSLQPPRFENIVPMVARRLPQDGTLVEVVWMRRYRVHAKATEPLWDAPSYVALVLRADQHIDVVDLGAASAVDELGLAMLSALRDPGTDPKPAARKMYEKILAPLLPYLDGKQDIFLSLDGLLNLIPFDALHDASDYLLGRYRFHYLTSGRDLLRVPSKRKSQAPMLVSNPDFGKVDMQPSMHTSANLYQRLAGLSDLPGTQEEADMLEPLLKVRALTRDAATEEAVRRAHAPRILHIATHGIFLPETTLKTPEAAQPRQMNGTSDRSSLLLGTVSSVNTEFQLDSEEAMNRSALALAGVLQGHHQVDSTKDGLLSANEARSLDLDGTQLATLSACETGQGTLSAGQGVYGLRRAFIVAGAETLVTSLWRVHDGVTRELMALYYQKLLDRRKPGDRLGAMLDTMQELRRRAGRSHPYYWAPFLVIGQDGPLRP